MERADAFSIRDYILKGSAWALGGKVVAAACGVLVNALLARLLPPTDLGVYFLAFAIASIGVLVGPLGSSQVVIRQVAEGLEVGDRAGVGRALLTGFGLTAIGTMAFALILLSPLGHLLAGGLLHSPALAGVLAIVAVWTAASAFQRLAADAWRGFKEIARATTFETLGSNLLALSFFTVVWIWRPHVGLGEILWLTALSCTLPALLGAWFLWREIGPWEGKSDGMQFRLLHAAWPLLVTNVMLYVLAQADLWLVGALRTTKDVAVYGAAQRLVLLQAAPLLIVNAVVPPIIAQLYARGARADLQHWMRKVAGVATVPALVLLAIFIVFGGQILSLVYGPFYVEGHLVLAILGIGQVLNVWAGSCGMALIMTGQERAMMSITVPCALLTVVLSWLGGASYGIAGVAVGSTIGLAIQNLSMVIAARRRLGIWTHAGRPW